MGRTAGWMTERRGWLVEVERGGRDGIHMTIDTAMEMNVVMEGKAREDRAQMLMSGCRSLEGGARSRIDTKRT